jgi:hypothetical protein
MIIKSKFKDYYDYVAGMYGGGDPRVVYARTRLAPLGTLDGGFIESHLTVEVSKCPLISPTSFNHRYAQRQADIQVAYLVAAGKLYLVSRPADSCQSATEGFVLADETDELFKLNPWSSRATSFGIECRTEHPFLIELSRLAKAPVFLIESISWNLKGDHATVRIAGQCPILKDLGMASIVRPEAMYQDLSYFMGILMHNTPDINPPAVLSEKERIVKAGFDLKQSFRHRT